MTYKDTPDPRYNLPNRRLTENLKVTLLNDQTMYLSIGYDPADPERSRKVFYSSGFKSGSQMEFQIQNTCVLFSLLLQHGLQVADVAKSLSKMKQPDGLMVYASVVGLIAAELIK